MKIKFLNWVLTVEVTICRTVTDEYKIVDNFLKADKLIHAVKALRSYRMDNGGDSTLKATVEFCRARRDALELEELK